MNSVSPTQAAEGAAAKPPTRRALAKQQTRVKVLAAARRLFSEQGYEGATIRDIATAAGMSTGAVFANFTDKSDLFREIMMADLASLAEAMAAAGRRGVDIGDVLLKIFMAGYEFYLTQLPLARAAFSVAWSLEDGPALRNSPPLIHLRGLMVAALRDAVAKGELLANDQLELRGHMLFESYLANYPQAIFEGWSLDALKGRSRDQIGIVLAGIAKR